VKKTKATKIIGLRPKASEKDAKTGWIAAEHKTKEVPVQKASVLLASSSDAMV